MVAEKVVYGSLKRNLKLNDVLYAALLLQVFKELISHTFQLQCLRSRIEIAVFR